MLREIFLQGMSNAASTVNIVTTDGPAGRAGLTVSAMCSVSADPPSLLVCVNAQSKSAEIISQNGVFCVNVLDDSQVHISNAFSSRIETNEKFACASWENRGTGSPMLADALVNFDCKLSKSFRSGSHYIFVGDVVDIEVKKSGNPLIYANRSYGRAVKMTDIAPVDVGHTTSERYRVGSYLTASAFFMPGLIANYHRSGHRGAISLIEGARDHLLSSLRNDQIDIAIIYQRGKFEERGLQADFLSSVSPYVLLAKNHVLAKQGRVSLRELAAQPLISLGNASAGSGFIDSIFGDLGIEPMRAYKVPSFEMLRGMVGHGLGYAITFTDPASRMSYDGMPLVRLPIIESIQPGELVLAHRAEGQLSSEVKGFIDFCRRYFSRLIEVK